jgi:hypothetical protein
VSFVSVASERQNGRVFDEQQAIHDLIVSARGRKPLLEIPAVAVGHPAQPFGLDRLRDAGIRRGRWRRERGEVHPATIAASRQGAVVFLWQRN